APGSPLQQILDRFLAHGWQVTPGDPAPDIVLFDGHRMEEQFGAHIEQQHPNALRVLTIPLLHSLREARQALLRRRLVTGLDPNDFRELFTTSGSDLYQQMAPTELAQREIAAIHRSDLSLVTSDVEIDLLVNGFGVPPDLLHWCPPLLLAPQAMAPFGEREHMVGFVDFRDPADWDAVLWLRHNIWPMTRRHLPDVQLRLYGPSPTEKALALHDPVGGLLIHEQPEVPLDVMSKARLCLAPLRFGAGTKAVLANALLAGTPAIITPIGSEAMHGNQPWPGLVSGTAEGLAKAAISLYSDEARWNQAQRDARQVLERHFNPQWHGAALVQRIQQTLMGLADQRLYNFTGAMLRRSR
ncbi:glycosyltransferase, partial [Pseudomonas putida]|uniref:glycosyltransferase n=1 Tax=Pseudomonas putida TaxID=303 RepID=UPI000952CB6B